VRNITAVMKYLTAFFCVIVLAISASCMVAGRKITPRRIDFAGMGYNSYTLFVYHTTHKDSSGKILKEDTLGLFCAPETWTIGQVSENYINWAVLGKQNTRYYIKGINNSCTGAIVTDTSLFLHPHRDDYYKPLECCSYPYFSKMISIGDTFTWQLEIGSFWASATYPIKHEDTFTTVYHLTDTGTMNTTKGSQYYNHFTSTTTSIFGTSHASWYLCNNVGLVEFSITDIDNSQYQFHLAERITDRDSMKFNTFFSWTVERARLRPGYIYFDGSRKN
jgi:hypothetical protein